MRNCLILGSGRSGTSMLAGVLAKAGYFMGKNLYPGRESNPKGFFEGPEINGINEQLLARLDLSTFSKAGDKSFDGFSENEKLTKGQRWLLRVPIGVDIPALSEDAVAIEGMVAKAPFCYKDPRFSYTLPVWRPHLKDTVFLCVFRHPAATASSMVKECNEITDWYYKNVVVTYELGLEVWSYMYRWILEKHIHEGKWLFIHYNQILTEEGLGRIADFTGASIDRTFPDTALRRSTSDKPIPSELGMQYKELCKLAGYSD